MNSMLKSFVQKSLFASAMLTTVVATQASAMSLDWSGQYRFEAVQIDSTTLGTPGESKSYLLHNLVLSPRVIAADGIEVISQFSILGNQMYPGSMVGQTFGGGDRSFGESHSMSRNAGTANLSVRQMYLNINQEFGQIVVGRAPIEFGLGMTYNAGRGAFDHWGDTYDMVGYKFLVGNLSFMPILAKPYSESAALGNDVTDLMMEVMYDNKETESQFGILHSQRSAGPASSDAEKAISGTAAGGYSVQSTNVFIGRGWESFKFKIEAGFTNGKTGLVVGQEEVKANGYGLVMDLAFPRPDGAWDWNLRAGVVSGDNPSTDNFEGYALNRNYDIGFLMFNHPMGGYDLFRTSFQRNRDASCTTLPCGTYANDQALDEEAISNTIFVNPAFTYKFSDRWSWRNSLVYAQLQTSSSTVAGNDVNKDLGFELDSALIFKPHGRFQWVNEVGVLFPGEAWKEGNVGRDAKFNYGIQSKAAISF